MTRLIVVRHGYSVANSKGLFSCMQDVPLTELGIRQAQHVARYLFESEKIDKIYTSGMQRTIQTATPVAELFGLPLHTERDLREIFAGLWEGAPIYKMHLLFPEDWGNWLYDFSKCRCTLGESTRELYHRVSAAVRRIAEENEGKTVLIATHYTPLRMMLAMGEGLSAEQLHLTPESTNASLSIFEYEEGTLKTLQSNLIVYPKSLLFTRTHPAPPKMPKYKR